MLQRGERLHDCSGPTDYDQPASSSSQQISAHYLGFIQPLNHTRHRNPLVSVTVSPTQEARSQSTIWMLWCLSSSFPSWFIYHPSILQDFPKTVLLSHFMHLLHTVYFHFCICSSLSIISRFYQLHPPPPKKKQTLPHPSVKNMYGIHSSLEATELTISVVPCLKHVNMMWQLDCIFIRNNHTDE